MKIRAVTSQAESLCYLAVIKIDEYGGVFLHKKSFLKASPNVSYGNNESCAPSTQGCGTLKAGRSLDDSDKGG